jgi:hydrocephalus-inducing protein
VTFVGSADLVLSIIEPLTTNKEEVLPIKVSGRAVFSKYAVTPARGLHFGPITAATSAKPKMLEVANLGEFEVKMRLSDFAIPLPEEVADPKKKGREEAEYDAGPSLAG